jgi:hypothetical protein
MYKVMQGMTHIHMLTGDRLSPEMYPVDYYLVRWCHQVSGHHPATIWYPPSGIRQTTIWRNFFWQRPWTNVILKSNYNQ